MSTARLAKERRRDEQDVGHDASLDHVRNLHCHSLCLHRSERQKGRSGGGVALFGLTAIATTVSQILWTRRKLREGQTVERLEASFDLSRQREDASLLGRLNEFGWNALPAYLAALGGLFLVSGLAAGDLRNAGFGGVLVGISIFKRRQEGAWYRRF